MKKYTQAPLPFQGQKRRFVKRFKEVLQESYNDKYVFVDLFGGSGLLSHATKTIFPKAKVLYNDFDDYRKRIQAIPMTNIILRKLRKELEFYPRNKRITDQYRDSVLNILQEANKKGFVDYITLSASLKFSMNYSTSLEGFTDDTLYNTIRRSDYEATGYLQGVEVAKMDYKALFEQYKDVPNVCFLVDPPYLSTDTATYNSKEYWKLRDYLDVLQVLHNNSYFYFTSNKSQIVELCEWVSSVSAAANPFAKSTKTAINTSTTYNAKYTDIMYHLKR